MSVLNMDRVTRRHAHPRHERTLLRNVTLQIDAGELIAVWGRRRSGRTTLLRVAAGIEPPDHGTIHLENQNLTHTAGNQLGDKIAYCPPHTPTNQPHTTLEDLIATQLARGTHPNTARKKAWRTLEQTNTQNLAHYPLRELDTAEQTRITIARALLSNPALLIIDEPIKGIDLLERDPILTLLRTLTNQHNLATLMSTSDAAALTIADRALTLSDGELRGALQPELAPLIPLPLRANRVARPAAAS